MRKLNIFWWINLYKQYFGIALVFLFCLLRPISSPAAVFEFFDIDGTLFHDSGIDEQGKQPAWRVYWILQKILQINNFHLSDLDHYNSLPEKVYLTRDEIDRLRTKLGKGDERLGDMSPVDLNVDPVMELEHSTLKSYRPKSFVPGYYKIDLNSTFNDHRDISAENSTLIERTRAAIARVRAEPDKYEFRGPAFPYLARAINVQSADHHVYILSDQDRRQTSIDQMLNLLYKENYLGNPVKTVGKGGEKQTYKPNFISSAAAGAAEFGSYLNGFTMRKGNAIAQFVFEVMRSDLPTHKSLSPDSFEASKGIERSLHEVRIYENSPVLVENIVAKLKRIAADLPNVKFEIFYSGDMAEIGGIAPPQNIEIVRTEVKNLKKGRWLIITPSNSGLRLPTAEEEKILEISSSASQKPRRQCSNISGGN